MLSVGCLSDELSRDEAKKLLEDKYLNGRSNAVKTYTLTMANGWYASTHRYDRNKYPNGIKVKQTYDAKELVKMGVLNAKVTHGYKGSNGKCCYSGINYSVSDKYKDDLISGEKIFMSFDITFRLSVVTEIKVTGVVYGDSKRFASVEYEKHHKPSPFAIASNIMPQGSVTRHSSTFQKYDDGWRFSY